MRGTRFKLYPQPSFLADFKTPETVYISPSPAASGRVNRISAFIRFIPSTNETLWDRFLSAAA